MKTPKLSRRSFLKTSALTMAGVALASCAAPVPPAAAPTTAPAATAEQKAESKPTPTVIPTPAGFSTTGDKGNIDVVYWADSNQSFKTVVDKFTEETGIGVTYEVAPAGYLTWQQFMTTRLASGDTTTDAFHCDDFQAAIYGQAGWLEPLEPTIQKYSIDLADWPQTLIKDVSSWKGKLYRLPWGNDTEIFFYRTDYFKEAGVEPPKTWEELVEVAKKLTKDDRYGIALSGSKTGELGNEIQHWTNQAGGAINRLDDPGSKEAIVFYKELFSKHKVAPASVPQEDYSTVFQGWLGDKYAMWWCWDGFFGAMRTNKDFWKSQVSAFLPPMGPKNAQTVTGCWGWAISAYSEKKELAEQWVGFTARPEIMKLQILRGRVPARMSLWSDPEVQDQAPSAPFLEALAKAGPDSVKARPVTPSIQEIYDAAEQNIHSYLTDQVNVETAIDNAMKKIKPILDRDMGS
ncbi:MAG: extracellular solute-binding protein [Chloroflexi bacterium]|nr:extracellular solute-binding protein [Chloroflexota bacterium]